MTSRLSRIGLGLLAVMTVLNLLLHAVGIVVALVPLRAGERWAWAASWIQVAATAAVMPIGLASGDETALPFSYLGFAAVMGAGLLFLRRSPEPR